MNDHVCNVVRPYTCSTWWTSPALYWWTSVCAILYTYVETGGRPRSHKETGGSHVARIETAGFPLSHVNRPYRN